MFLLQATEEFPQRPGLDGGANPAGSRGPPGQGRGDRQGRRSLLVRSKVGAPKRCRGSKGRGVFLIDFLGVSVILIPMRDTLVIDVETKKAFAEVGGEQNIRELGISIAGVYSYARDAFFAYEEHELPELGKMLQEADHVIGFNIKHFDIPVMEPYLGKTSFEKIVVTDLFEHVFNSLGHRAGLGALAKATLGEGKSGHGLEALQWFREGRVDEVKKYCLDDVRLTRDLYEYGKKHGHVLFESNIDGKTRSVPVAWGREIKKPLRSVIEEALERRRRLAIEYISSEDSDGMGFRKARLIDVYAIRNNEIEAYCHLRRALRKFRIQRIVKAELTGDSYTIPRDAQSVLF